MEFDISMHSRMVSSFAGREKAIGNFAFSEFIRIAGNVPRTRGRCGCQFEKHLLRQVEPE